MLALIYKIMVIDYLQRQSGNGWQEKQKETVGKIGKGVISSLKECIQMMAGLSKGFGQLDYQDLEKKKSEHENEVLGVVLTKIPISVGQHFFTRGISGWKFRGTSGSARQGSRSQGDVAGVTLKGI